MEIKNVKTGSLAKVDKGAIGVPKIWDAVTVILKRDYPAYKTGHYVAVPKGVPIRVLNGLDKFRGEVTKGRKETGVKNNVRTGFFIDFVVIR